MTRPQSEPIGIGIPDGTPRPRQAHCSGASLPVDLASYRALERTGVRWETRSEDIAPEGRTDARVECAGQAVTMQRGNTTYSYALCRECMALEARFRAALAAAKAKSGEGR